VAFIDDERWPSEGIRIGPDIPCRAGMNRIANPNSIKTLLSKTEQAFSSKVVPATTGELKPSLHDDIKEKLRAIGQLQSYLSETECKLNGERLDVALTCPPKSSPAGM
jgi:hypothetical protein